MGIPQLSGRDFTERDNETAPKIVVINQSLARHFFGGSNPIGRRIRFERQDGGVDAEGVGVVKDLHHPRPRKAPPPIFYAPAVQDAGPGPGFEVRGAGDPRALTGTLVRVLQAAGYPLDSPDPNL